MSKRAILLGTLLATLHVAIAIQYVNKADDDTYYYQKINNKCPAEPIEGPEQSIVVGVTNDGTVNGLIGWDLSSLPSNIYVNSAKVLLTIRNGTTSTGTIEVHLLTSNTWGEETICDTAPSYDSAVITKFSTAISSNQQQFNLDLTDAFTKQLAAKNTYIGFAFIPVGSFPNISIISNDAPSNAPQLTLGYLTNSATSLIYTSMMMIAFTVVLTMVTLA